MELEKYLKETDSGWEWDWHPSLENTLKSVPDTLLIYKRTLESVTILHTKIFESYPSLRDFTFSELIAYIHMFGMSRIQTREYRNNTYAYCVICSKMKFEKFDHFSSGGCTHDVCSACMTSQNLANFYVNHDSGNGDTFEGLIEHKLDVGLKIGSKMHFLYHSTFKLEKFNYKMILFEPWYHQAVKQVKNGVVLCKLCKNNKRHLNSTCLICLNYSYKISFEFVIKGWLMLKNIFDNIDVLCVIFSRLLKMLDYNIKSAHIYSFYQHKLIVKLETPLIQSQPGIIKDDEDFLYTDKDLITEHTLHKYIDHDYNAYDSNSDDSCELGQYYDDDEDDDSD